MLTQDRRQKILELINQNGAVTVAQLSQRFDSSESTIRRDLIALANLGKINKVHGGATVASQEFLKIEDSIEAKSLKNVELKIEIAKYAVSQIYDDDFVFIDAGSTTYLMATLIENSGATFVTNGIAHANVLAKKGCRVFVIGGELKQSTEAIVGLGAASDLQKYNFSKAFIGVNGVSEKQGFTTPDTDEAMLKAIAMEHSFVSYVLCDSTKFNKISAVSFGSIDSAGIICDKCEDKSIKEKAVVKEVL